MSRINGSDVGVEGVSEARTAASVGATDTSSSLLELASMSAKIRIRAARRLPTPASNGKRERGFGEASGAGKPSGVT
jgi:hypothetical protein